VAKIPMLCPFSKELCRECTLYRGRHYYICFRKEYWGYLGPKSDFRDFAKNDNSPVVIRRRKPK
jgi:hypothetical protein